MRFEVNLGELYARLAWLLRVLSSQHSLDETEKRKFDKS